MEEQRFRNLLKDQGYFVTRPRLQLFKVMQERSALPLKELIALLPDQDPVTVYRTVNLFEKLGILNHLRLGWQSKLELSDLFHRHHHHFTCLNCGTVIDLPEDTTIERRIHDIALHYQFTSSDHILEIRGLCQRCQVQKNPARNSAG